MNGVTLTLVELIRNRLFEKWYQQQKRTTLIVFIMGSSGVGKSSFMLKLMYYFEKFAREREQKPFYFDLDKQIAYTPREYGVKIKNWIESDFFTFGIDEARFLVSAKTWQSFVNRVVTEVNATIRQLKKQNTGNCGIIFLNSQTFYDVDKSLRKTVRYLIHLKEKNENEIYANFYEIKYNIADDKLYIKKFDINLTDFEVAGHLKINLLEDRELLNQFHNNVVEAKTKILLKKFESLDIAIGKELGEVFNANILKNEEVFQLLKNMATFSEKKGVYFTKEKQMIIMKMFNLTKKEFKEVFMPAFINELKERNLI
ncbi:MAG: hypothetical protein QXY78_04245 [Thermoplasmata archaeon]